MSGTLTDDFSSYASLQWAGESYSAFAHFAATRDSLVVKYVSTNQETVYSYTLNNPNTFQTSSGGGYIGVSFEPAIALGGWVGWGIRVH